MWRAYFFIGLLLIGTNADVDAETLLIANYSGANVKAVDSAGGVPYTFNGTGGSLSFPRGITIGPDGNVYVGSEGNSRVERYLPSGVFLDTFIPEHSGDLLSVHQVRFGPDGDFYVSVSGSFSGSLPSRIHRFDGTTGADLGMFTVAGGGSNPHGFVWGPDGDLYVADADGVQKYNGTTGVFLSTFVFVGASGLVAPRDVLFDSLGDLLVVDGTVDGKVLKFSGSTGSALGTLIPTGVGPAMLQRPESILLGSDGAYYLGNTDKNNILRFTADGTFIDVYATGGGLLGPSKMVFVPETISLFTALLLCLVPRLRGIV